MYFSKRVVLLVTVLVFSAISQLKAQQIDVDSLLRVVIEKSKDKSQTDQTIALARLGIQESPDYLDFHLLLGRVYKEIGWYDSARYFLNHVIDNNPAYKDAFSILIPLELEQGQLEEGFRLSEMAINNYPNEPRFYVFKHAFIQLEKDERKEFDFLKSVINQYDYPLVYK